MLWFLYGASGLATTASLAYVFLALAPEASQGFVQKIFFFHLPAAFSMYLCLFVGLIGSLGYLIKRNNRFDEWARAGMSTSLIFSFVVLASGPIWAKPIWGVYWTWDPRLTTSFIIFVLQLAYVFSRRAFDERRQYSRSALVGAILCLIAVLDIPLIHFSVKLWRGVHPSVIRNPDGLPEDYRRALEMMTGSFFLLAALFIIIFHLYFQIQNRLRERSSS